MSKIYKKVYVVFSILTLTIFLSACDSEKGTLDGVISCINENEDKVGILSERFVRKACFRKHEKTVSDPTSSCSAAVETNSEKVTVTFTGKCRNESKDKLITSVTTKVTISNIPKAGKKKWNI